MIEERKQYSEDEEEKWKNGIEEAIAKHGSRLQDQFMPERVGLFRYDNRARQAK